MKKLLFGLGLILGVSLMLCGLIACTGCKALAPQSLYSWREVTPGHWETRVEHLRCAGCPATRTNTFWVQPTYVWMPVNN